MTIGLLGNLLSFGQQRPVSNNSNTVSCGCNSNANTGSNNISGGLLGGLLGAKTNLIGNILGGMKGGSSVNNNPIGSVVGGLAQGVHHTAENVIASTGLGSVFAPVDAAVIHPVLWDPISLVTGVDVSSHPAGVANVSNPLKVPR